MGRGRVGPGISERPKRGASLADLVPHCGRDLWTEKSPVAHGQPPRYRQQQTNISNKQTLAPARVASHRLLIRHGACRWCLALAMGVRGAGPKVVGSA